MNGQPKVSIFLSSPADVTPEREAAEWVVQRLNGVYAAHVELAAKRWEQHFYEAARGFQEAIAPMETFDIVVGILWKRIGSELPPERFSRPNGTPYESGTVYEIESALTASRRSGRPSVYVFKSERPITYTAERVDEERAQKEALDRWWGRTFRDETGRHIAATNSFGDTEEFEAKFENCLVDWIRDRGYIPSGPVWDVETQGSPYPGLVAYDRKHSPVFFGRHLAIENAREELLGAEAREGGRPVLFVIGASGSGKSSLVRAGLVPRLTRPGVVPGVDLWRTVITVAAPDSLGPLAAHLYSPDGLPELGASAQRDPERWARMASGDPEAAADSLTWALDRIGEAERLRSHADRKIEARLLLVVDQLEGLFGTPGQKAFTNVLRALVGGGRVWLLATLRSDRYTDLQLNSDLLALKRAGATYDLPPPGPAEIADIVKGPARAAGLTFAERHGISLARVLVEAAPNADALPLLQMTLAQLFERREGAELTFGAYDAMGEVEGAIAAYADGVFAHVPLAAQRELGALVRPLIRDVVRSRSDNQVRFTVRDADRKAFETSEARKQLVEVLVNGRLLVSDGGKLRVAHEALLRRWERARDSLRKLADAELRKVRVQRALAIAASVVFLAVAWYASQQREEATHSAKEAQHNAEEAQLNETRALTALASSEASFGSPATALRLALTAIPADGQHKGPEYPREIEGAILNSLLQLQERRRINNEHSVVSVTFSPDGRTIAILSVDGIIHIFDARTGEELRVLKDEKYQIRAISFNHNHDTIAVILDNVDDPLQLWDAATATRVASLQYDDTDHNTIVFSSDDKTIATGVQEYSSCFRLWNVIARKELKKICGDSDEGSATSIAFSFDGNTLAVGNDSAHVLLYDLRNGPPITPYKYIRGKYFDDDGYLLDDESSNEAPPAGQFFESYYLHFPVAFSPDNRILVTGSGTNWVHEDYNARLWNVSNGVEIADLSGHVNDVIAVNFSHDGQMLATGSDDNTVRLWDVANAKEVATLRGHESSVRSVSFSPDGSMLASGSMDGTVRLWDIRPTGDIATLAGHAQFVAFDPNGLLGATVDGATVHVWDMRTKNEVSQLRHNTDINDFAFSPDGQLLATSCDDDGTARLWNVRTGKVVTSFSTGLKVKAVAFSPDNGPFVTAASHFDGDASHNFVKRVVTLWDVPSGKKIADIPEANSEVLDVAFSPDGRTLAIGSDDKVAHLWDVATRKEIATLEGHTDWVMRVAFSPDRKTLATGSDRNVRLWDLPTGSEIGLLSGHQDAVVSLAFSPDGRTLVTAGGRDKTLRIWDLPSRKEIGKIAYQHSIFSVAFAPDGQSILVGASENVTHIWPMGRNLIEFGCARVRELPLTQRDRDRLGIRSEWCTPEVSEALRAKFGIDKSPTDSTTAKAQ